ncbi:MAG: stage 0 sporulation family protein [Desulfobacterales bacterium]|jgi:cell fate regulator YaaT (PSP1 superfamily)|nr:stage 0 sporulation family protein [Desulfobacterales bacterium]
MKKVVGIRFKSAGKVYDFECGAYVLNPGDHVIVETEQGLGFGTVAMMPRPYDEMDAPRPLKKIFRPANQTDFSQIEKNRQTEKDAHAYCVECIKELNLSMNLFSVESTFDGGKLTFFFTAESRVDFRQLVKLLVKKLGARIEMRQVGIRNQAKMCGGLGRCGRVLCCASFLDKFEPVSIRMAKEQGLSLNPTKISGQCGRLMCCLTYEFETYRQLKKGLPKIGKKVMTEKGIGKVIRHNVIGNRISVRLEDGIEMEVPIDAIKKEDSEDNHTACDDEINDIEDLDITEQE